MVFLSEPPSFANRVTVNRPRRVICVASQWARCLRGPVGRSGSGKIGSSSGGRVSGASRDRSGWREVDSMRDASAAYSPHRIAEADANRSIHQERRLSSFGEDCWLRSSRRLIHAWICWCCVAEGGSALTPTAAVNANALHSRWRSCLSVCGPPLTTHVPAAPTSSLSAAAPRAVRHVADVTVSDVTGSATVLSACCPCCSESASS